MALGADVQLIMPGYADALDAAANKSVRAELEDVIGLGSVRVIQARTPDAGLPVWLVDCPRLFGRAGLYQDERGRDWPDNASARSRQASMSCAVAWSKLNPLAVPSRIVGSLQPTTVSARPPVRRTIGRTLFRI